MKKFSLLLLLLPFTAGLKGLGRTDVFGNRDIESSPAYEYFAGGCNYHSPATSRDEMASYNAADKRMVPYKKK